MDVRVVRGTGTGPTELASYDAALAAAGAHNYNLVPVSSVLPADAAVSVVETAPDLGPAGGRLTVVEARATAAGPGHVSAALGWATGEGPGIVYESAGEFEEADARERVTQGLAAGRSLREWDFSAAGMESVTAAAEPGTYTTALVLAILGEAEPLG